MISFACLVTAAVFVLDFCSSDNTAFTTKPRDSSVLLGGEVKFECFMADKNYPPAWSHQKIGSTNRDDVSLVLKQSDHIVASIKEDYAERYKIIENREAGEYSLQITNVKAEDAGDYACKARGGLGETASAKLTVLESPPECASSIVEALGENDCNQDPDIIEFTCRFRVYSNPLPKIVWADANHPENPIANFTQVTDDTGFTRSKLIIKGDYVGLDETSFKCLVVAAGNSNDQRFSCVTPKITVLKMTNVTDSKTFLAPEEVECPDFPKLHISRRKWIRRDEDDQQETVVSVKSMLNLHRSDMKSGTYICIGDCMIRGQPCQVQLFSVIYQPSESIRGEESRSLPSYTTIVINVIVTIIFVAAAIGVGLGLKVLIKKYLKERTNGSPSSSPLLYPERSPNETKEKSNEQSSDPSLDSEKHADTSSSSNSGVVSVDIPDAKLGGPKLSDRARLAEERADARMRANAAARQKEQLNQGYTPDDHDANTDNAEGVAADSKKTE